MACRTVALYSPGALYTLDVLDAASPGWTWTDSACLWACIPRMFDLLASCRRPHPSSSPLFSHPRVPALLAARTCAPRLCKQTQHLALPRLAVAGHCCSLERLYLVLPGLQGLPHLLRCTCNLLCALALCCGSRCGCAVACGTARHMASRTWPACVVRQVCGHLAQSWGAGGGAAGCCIWCELLWCVTRRCTVHINLRGALLYQFKERWLAWWRRHQKAVAVGCLRSIANRRLTCSMCFEPHAAENG